MIDGAPEIVFCPVDLHEHLIEVPSPLPETPHRLNTTAPDLRRENRPEPVPPEPHRLMRDVDAALMQQVFDVPQRKRVAEVHHHRQANDLRRSLEVPKNAGVAHSGDGSAALPVSGKPIFL